MGVYGEHELMRIYRLLTAARFVISYSPGLSPMEIDNYTPGRGR
jgi:hypothetical protein